MTIGTQKLLNAVTVTGAGAGVKRRQSKTAIQATVAGTGAVSAIVAIEVSNNGINWCTTPVGTITISGTTTAGDGFVIDAPWKYVRGNVTSISGTGAALTLVMAEE